MLNRVVLLAGAAYDATYPLPITCRHIALAETRGLLLPWS